VYFELAALVADLTRRERRTAEEIARTMELTAVHAGQLLGEAEEIGLVHSEADAWLLTSDGKALAAAVNSGKAAAISRGRERFRPYTDYIPQHWWPD
jgi:hypothetical protein